MSEPLTDEQVENWRKVLLGMIGPYALIMPREDIQAFREKTQKAALQMGEPGRDPPEDIDRGH